MPPSDDPTVLDAMDVLRRYILRDHRGVRVGKVVKYNGPKRTADVQPFRRRRIRGTVFDENPVVDAPVGSWRLGGMVMACELEKGDEVLIVTCEREIRPWWLGGKVHDPQSQRMHAAEDSVILPWISNAKRAITAHQAGTLWLGREDGSAGLTITRGPAPGRTTLEGTGPGSIALGSGATSPVVLFTDYAAAWSTLAGTLAGLLTTLQAVPPASTLILTAAMANANNAAIEGALAAFATFAAQVAGMASVKVVAE